MTAGDLFAKAAPLHSGSPDFGRSGWMTGGVALVRGSTGDVRKQFEPRGQDTRTAQASLIIIIYNIYYNIGFSSIPTGASNFKL